MKSFTEILDFIFFRPIQIDKTFWVVCLMICSISAGAFTTYKAVRRVGQPFQNFFVGENLMVSVGQRAAWDGVEAGLKPLDKILEINSRPIKSVEEFKNIIRTKNEGDVLSYTIERNKERRVVSVPVRMISLFDFWVCYVGPFAIGLIFLILGTITLYYVPNLRISYLYFILCSLIGVFGLVFYEAYTSHTFFRYTQVYPLMAAVAVHLFAVFPEKRRLTEIRAYLIVWIYMLSIVLVGLRQYYLFNQDVAIILSQLSSFFVALMLLLIVALLIEAIFRAKTNVAKDRARVLLAGLIIASSAVGLWSINYLFKRTSFYLDQAILISLVFPIFMSYAILKKNIFDMDRMLRVSLTYTVSAGVVILCYFVVIATVGFVWPRILREETLLGVFALLAIIGAFVFKTLNRKVQVLIYKIFFREKYDRLQTLMDYGKRLSSGLHIDEISKLLVSDLVKLMDLKGAALVAYYGDSTAPEVLLSKGVDIEAFNFNLDRRDSKLLRLLEKNDKPQLLDELRTVRTTREVEGLELAGVELVIPIKSKEKILAILFLLGKSSVDIFNAEDLEFLSALTTQAAVSLENAKLYIEKSKHERLAAIGQVASVIIHEIKNPLGVIKVSAGTIRRKFDKADSTYELATFIEKEVSRMNRTIQQILSFAKPKENRLDEFNLENLILDTINGMEKEFSEKEIEMKTKLINCDKALTADQDKIRRAILNLLTNARDFADKGGEVNVVAAIISGDDTSKGNDFIEISVEDDGKGMDEEQKAVIFQPFYTTKQEGTGLGLSIVKQIAEDHSGHLTVESELGKGSKFTIRIPKDRKSKIDGELQWNYQNRE